MIEFLVMVRVEVSKTKDFSFISVIIIIPIKLTFVGPLSAVARLSLLRVAFGLTSAGRTLVFDPVEVRAFNGVVERLRLVSVFDSSIDFSFFVSVVEFDSIRSLIQNNISNNFFFIIKIFYRVFCSSCTAKDKSLRSKILLFVVCIRSRHSARVKY